MLENLELEIVKFEDLARQRFLARRKLLKFIRQTLNQIKYSNIYLVDHAKRKISSNYMSDLSDNRIIKLLKIIKNEDY